MIRFLSLSLSLSPNIQHFRFVAIRLLVRMQFDKLEKVSRYN